MATRKKISQECTCKKQRQQGRFHADTCPVYVASDTICPECGDEWSGHNQRCRWADAQYLHGRIVRVQRCVNVGYERTDSSPSRLLCDQHHAIRQIRLTLERLGEAAQL